MTAAVDVVRALYQALAEGDATRMRAHLDSNIEWTEAEGFPLAGTYTGPDAVIENVLTPLARDWDDFRTVAEEFVDGGDTVVVLGRYSGTYVATRTDFEAPFAHVWRVKDAKAVRYVQYTDTFLVQRAIGAAT